MRRGRGVSALTAHIRGESMVTYGVSIGLVAVVCITALAQLQDVLGEEYRGMAARMAEADVIDRLVYASPCQDEYELGNRTDGVFQAEAASGGGALPVACHFETAAGLEGGWTVVAHQLDTAPALSWNAGISQGRSVSGYFDTSFTLRDEQLPPHLEMAVGRRLSNGYIEILDAVSAQYSTGDLDFTAGAALESVANAGVSYEIHRARDAAWCAHEPETVLETGETSEPWFDTLTFNELTPETTTSEGACGAAVDYTFAFSPKHPDAAARGYAYEGSKMATTDPYAWLVLVK